MTQEEALAILCSGKPALLTGAAGTGKTYTLNKLIRYMRSNAKTVSVTATTGLAATHLGGCTIHSWAGIGIADNFHNGMIQKMSDQRKKIINNTDVLIIDEVSMLHDFRLDIIDEVCRAIREDKNPFGNIQVILCGDFYQLPPVNRFDNRQGGFITNSFCWQNYDFNVCYLTEQYRQKEDQDYTDILNGIRVGALSKNQLSKLLAQQTKENKETTKLLTTNIDTDNINLRELNKLPGEIIEYEAILTGSKKYQEQLVKSCMAQTNLGIKIGAQVMCIKNSQDKKFVNGSQGEVIDYEKDTNYPVVKLKNGHIVTIKPDIWELADGEKIRATLTQIPIKLAWAITVHKSQGMTLDSAQIDLSKAFVEGMGYVALSRVKSLDKLYLHGINRMALLTSDEAKTIDKNLRLKSLETLNNNLQVIKDFTMQINKPSKETKVKDKAKSWKDKLEELRNNYPNVYKAWSVEDDEKLMTEFSKGTKITDIAKMLGRMNGSISARLKKHLGDDIFN